MTRQGPELPPSIDEARRMLECIEPRPHDTRKTVAFALFDGWDESAADIFFHWIERHPEHCADRAQEARAVWKSARRRGGITWRKLRWLARQGGWSPAADSKPTPAPTAGKIERRRREAAERAEREESERSERLQKAREKTLELIPHSTHADHPAAHPFFPMKGVQPAGPLRIKGKALIVLAFGKSGGVWSYQIITPTGEKRFQRGGSISGLWFPIPDLPNSHPPERIWIAEGLATALSVYEAIGEQTVVAFTAGNIPAVAADWRARFPNAEIIIAADNDRHTAGNPGLSKAKAAADDVGGRVVFPTFPDDQHKLTDFNDLHQHSGISDVRRQLLEGNVNDIQNPASEDISIDGNDDKTAGSKPTKPSRLLQIASTATYFHDREGNGYSRISINGHYESWPILSSGFRDWLLSSYYALTGEGVNSQHRTDALDHLQARARFDGEECSVYQRIARLPDRIVIDPCWPNWQMIEIRANGWTLVDDTDAVMIRRSGMSELPFPERGGSIAELRPYLNVRDDDFVLTIAWLVMALGGRGPFPVLVLQAEQGAGKSTASRLIRSLVDPSEIPLKAPPKTGDDLSVAALNAYVLALDNLSGISPEFSDILCRISTGAGITKRRLYSDFEEIQFNICRPIMLNGIDDIPTRPDLADRAIIVNLPSISPQRRKPESAFLAEFENIRGRVFGCLLDALSSALRHEGNVQFDSLPRLADFARWIVAAEPSLGWTAGTFSRVYARNIDRGALLGVEASPVGVALLRLVYRGQSPVQTMTATALLAALSQHGPDWGRGSQAWPRSARGLKDALRRLSAPLRQLGLVVTETRDARGRWIKLELRERRDDVQREIVGDFAAEHAPNVDF